MRKIKIRYTIKRTNGYVFTQTFTLQEIEAGCVETSFKVNFIGVGDIVHRDQFTGLCDKNDKEIWEGDILEYFQFSRICSKCAHRDKSVDEVKFNALGATLSSYRIIDPQADISELEIIGNIHENPELLAEKEK